MRCNQRFFGHEHFMKGTVERDFCRSLRVLKPAMSQYGFAMRNCPAAWREVKGRLAEDEGAFVAALREALGN